VTAIRVDTLRKVAIIHAVGKIVANGKIIASGQMTELLRGASRRIVVPRPVSGRQVPRTQVRLAFPCSLPSFFYKEGAACLKPILKGWTDP